MSLKNDFAVLEEIYNNLVPHWSAVLISCNHYLFYKKKLFKSGINSFCIWALDATADKKQRNL
jgi:hypothetical protein